MSTASLSICSSVHSGFRLMILRSYIIKLVQQGSFQDLTGLCQSSSMGMLSRTVLVMPSVNRTNSIWFPGPSQCGFRVKTSLKADACESAWLYNCGMYRKDDRGPLVECVEPMLRCRGGERRCQVTLPARWLQNESRRISSRCQSLLQSHNGRKSNAPSQICVSK